MSPAIARKTLRLLGQSKSHESKAATELIDSILSERERRNINAYGEWLRCQANCRTYEYQYTKRQNENMYQIFMANCM